MNSKKYIGLANEMREFIKGHRGVSGSAEKLIIDVLEASAFNIEQLDRHPELKLGITFMLQGTANALASKRVLHKCLGGGTTPCDERAIEECAVVIARAASQINWNNRCD